MAMPRSFDYIVVGAGSSGSVIAGRLSARFTVLLLEAGPLDSGMHGGEDVGALIRDPKNVILTTWDPNISKRYETVGQAQLAGRRIIINRGIVRGGCSTVNGMIYIRGNRRDYDTWAQLGCDGWSFAEVLPHFMRSEDFDASPLTYSPEDLAYHGVGGPLHVRPLPNPSALARAFIGAARELGYPGSESSWDFNGHQQENGAGLYQVTVTADGQRDSTPRAFLDPAASGRLTVVTGATASRLVIERGRAVGVECVRSGEGCTFRAEREVILSAGALGSPKLLMLSGIGPASDLRAKGIASLVDLPGVGQNLHDHLMIVTYYRSTKSPGQSAFTAEAGLFVNTRDRSGTASPDLQYHVLGRMPELPPWMAQRLGLPEDYFVICPTLVQPLSRGQLTLRSDVPDDDPLIQPNYFQCEADARTFMSGIEQMRALLATPSLRDFVASGATPFAIPGADGTPVAMPVGSGAALRAFVAATPTTPWHPVGTCKMGRDHLAVVDPELRVYGVDALRVADASIIPWIPSGNINATCIMVGEKCVDLVAA